MGPQHQSALVTTGLGRRLLPTCKARAPAIIEQGVVIRTTAPYEVAPSIAQDPSTHHLRWEARTRNPHAQTPSGRARRPNESNDHTAGMRRSPLGAAHRRHNNDHVGPPLLGHNRSRALATQAQGTTYQRLQEWNTYKQNSWAPAEGQVPNRIHRRDSRSTCVLGIRRRCQATTIPCAKQEQSRQPLRPTAQ